MLLIGYLYGAFSGCEIASSVYHDTIKVCDTTRDTVTYRQPIPVDSVVLHHKVIKLPLKDTVILAGDSIINVDSVFVEVPITQKEFEDSTYHAWVSGFDVNLDSISVVNKTVTVTERIRSPPKRWGLGVQVGAGYFGIDKKLSPYIGIGISYNFLMW